MDPLLQAITNDTFRRLVEEQRPEWALGQERVGGFQSVNSPEVAARRFAAATPQEAASNVWQTFKEDVTPGFWSKAAKMLAEMGKASQRKVSEEGPSMWDVAGNFPVTGAVLVGARAAKTLGGLQEAKFLAGVDALKQGKPADEVWRTWGVARNAEGKYVFEPPLQVGESDAIRQFAQMYPDVTVRVFRGKGERGGRYEPDTGDIYAWGDPGAPVGSPASRRRVVEHELQHKADDLEGMSYGTNLADPNYWKNAAEVRARAVEQRLSPEARKFAPQIHEDTPRLEQIIKQHPGAVAEAVKEPGGMWHPEAVERLADALGGDRIERQYARNAERGLWGDREALGVDADRVIGFHNWTTKAIRNYLNKYAGTERDPLKDIEIPSELGDRGVIRWEDAMDATLRQGTKTKFGDRPWELDKSTHTLENLQGYLSHVGDYLRQHVPPEKLAQYDLVRAVKETAANDARVAKEMEKAAQASMKDLPVYKDYGDGYKWVELKKPERLTEEQAARIKKTGFSDEGRRPYVALDMQGKQIENAYTGDFAVGRTPEEAHLAGQLAQEGNQMGHCVGGYCEGVASGESRIFSLRDAKGRSHVTVEVGAAKDEAGAEHPWTQYNDILQIKGKQNRAPSAEYLPYVQDFVRSGKWGEVGDLGNTGLYKTREGYITKEEGLKQLRKYYDGPPLDESEIDPETLRRLIGDL